jgi:hypothetical protein
MNQRMIVQKEGLNGLGHESLVRRLIKGVLGNPVKFVFLLFYFSDLFFIKLEDTKSHHCYFCNGGFFFRRRIEC